MPQSPPPPFRRPLLISECTEFDAGAERVALAVAVAMAVPLRMVFPLASNAEYVAVAPQAAAKAEHDAAYGMENLGALAEASGVLLETEVLRGPEPDREIVDEVARSNTDLLILRRRGKRGFLRRLLIGEMVSRVLDRGPCTMLVVPRLGEIWKRGVMVVIGDQDLHAAMTAAAAGAAFAQIAKVPLSLLVIASGDQYAAETALARMTAALAGRFRESRITRPPDAMQEVHAAVAVSVDLLVVAHGVPGTPPGELMRQMMTANEVPVLAVRC